jgi:hypothetical protein
MRNQQIVKTQKRSQKRAQERETKFQCHHSFTTSIQNGSKVDIKPYQGEINVVKLNHWLQQLEVYFSVHNIDEE